MATNEDNISGETNGGMEANGGVVVKAEMDAASGLQAELGKLITDAGHAQDGGALGGTVGAGAASSVTTPSQPIQVLSPQLLASLSSQGIILQGDGDNSKLLQTIKRALPTSSSGQTVTKVLITRNPGTKAVTSTATTVSGSIPTSKVQIIQSADGKPVLPGGSPIKLVTVTQGSNITKSVVIASSPGKQPIYPANKVALPPMKSPSKTITIATPTTPKKIAPASTPASGGQTIIMKGSVGSTPGTITLSSGAVAKVLNVINTTMAGSQVGGVGTATMPIQIQTGSGQQQQLAPGVTTIKATPTTTSASSTNIQPVQVSGTKFPYVRLVTVTTTTTTTTQAKPILQPANAKPIAPAPPAVTTLASAVPGGGATQRTINIPIAPAQTTVKGSTSQLQTGTQPRFIMPANAQLKIINAGKLPPGTTLLSAGGNLLQGFAVVPAQYIAQQQVPNQPQPPAQSNTSQTTNTVSQPPPPPVPSKHTSNGMLTSDGTGNRPRKPCNCTKSQCLKLYCDCFANGEFCRNCNCNNCLNNLEHEDDRAKAVKSCLDRNPMAFHPKIGKGQNGESNRRHNKGCNCKRSGCLKNYCECYEAKILCSSICKCVGCKNFEESPERKTLMHLADAAEVRVQQQTAARTKLSSQLQDYPTKTREFSDAGERLPFSFITHEVAEATLQCLMAQAEECERSQDRASLAESLILEEFGRCILQVIHSASKTKGVNPE